ncbi:transposase [Rhodobacterales bacterium HKCCSP123]|nr:transposase [Rhodobacterales bacterium HKCCSP123]
MTSGLTPSRSHSGERDVSGGISKAGDVDLRCTLRQAATVMLNCGRSNVLHTWASYVSKCRGLKRTMVALARRMAFVMHRNVGSIKRASRWRQRPLFEFAASPA